MCKYCEQKAITENDNYFDLYDNSIELVGGGYTALYIGVNAENKIVLRASGEDYTDDFIINFCPICGRDLRVKEEKEMEKFDYRKVLVSGNEYECVRTKNGRVHLFYVENDIKHMFSFDDTMHVDFLSNKSYFVTHERMILEIKSIDFINYKTGYTFFTGRIKFDEVISTES